MADISNDKLMEVLLDIKGDVGQVQGTLDSMAGIDERVRKVENKVHAWSFAGGLLGVMAGWLGMHIR